MGRKLGERLRRLREHHGGLKKVAPAIGVTYAYLSKIESGASEPSEETLARLAEFYGVDGDELFMLAGRLPPDVQEMLRAHPEKAVELLRRHFGSS